MTAADEKIFNIFPDFQKKLGLIFHETILMKYDAFFAIFEKEAKFEIFICCKL